MNQKEIANVYALKGGTAAWKGAGFPMEPTAGKAPAAGQTPPERPPVL